MRISICRLGGDSRGGWGKTLPWGGNALKRILHSKRIVLQHGLVTAGDAAGVFHAGGGQ